MAALKVTFYSIFFCTFTIFLSSFINPSSNIIMLTNLNMWFWTLFLAIVPTIISLLFLVKAIQISASILGALESLTALFVVIFLFNEKISITIVFGIFLILFAVFLIVLKDYLIKIFKLRV